MHRNTLALACGLAGCYLCAHMACIISYEFRLWHFPCIVLYMVGAIAEVQRYVFVLYFVCKSSIIYLFFIVPTLAKNLQFIWFAEGLFVRTVSQQRESTESKDSIRLNYCLGCDNCNA